VQEDEEWICKGESMVSKEPSSRRLENSRNLTYSLMGDALPVLKPAERNQKVKDPKTYMLYES
jgi:hypothetical protein